MITVHILEANLKVLPGKIILLLTEPLTHSLRLPPGQQRSCLRREGREGTLLTCHTQSVLSTAEGWASHLSGRDGFQGWQDPCAFLKKPLWHTECWHPGRHCSFLESMGVEPALHLQESPANMVQVTCSFPSHSEQELLWVLPSKELGTKEIVLNAFKKKRWVSSLLHAPDGCNNNNNSPKYQQLDPPIA